MNADSINPSERIQIDNEQQLESAFYGHRQGPYGAFHFSHTDPYPWLSVLINDSVAYVHYFPAEGHAGFHSVAATNTQPAAADQMLHFLQAGGDEGSSFDICRSMTVPVEAALTAAKRFLATPSLPTCINWEEL